MGTGLTAPRSPAHECQGAVGSLGWLWALRAVAGESTCKPQGGEKVPEAGAPHAWQLQAGQEDLIW